MFWRMEDGISALELCIRESLVVGEVKLASNERLGRRAMANGCCLQGWKDVLGHEV